MWIIYIVLLWYSIDKSAYIKITKYFNLSDWQRCYELKYLLMYVFPTILKLHLTYDLRIIIIIAHFYYKDIDIVLI